MMRWRVAALSAALCTGLTLGPADARDSTGAADPAIGVRLVRWDAAEPLRAPFGKLSRRVAFTRTRGAKARRHYESRMALRWSYRSLIARGPGAAWVYDGARADVESVVERFSGEESDVDYAPEWFAHAELRPAGGSGDLISLLVDYSDHAGGAHGTSFQHFMTLSSRTGRPLRLPEVLSASACARIHSAITDSVGTESLGESTSNSIDAHFGIRRELEKLRVSITLPYLFDGPQEPGSTFHFELSPRELLPAWRLAK